MDGLDYIGFYLRAAGPYTQPQEVGYAPLLAMMLNHTNKLNSTAALIKAFAANQSVNTTRVVGRQLLAVASEGMPEDIAYLFDTFTSMLFTPSFQHWELKDSVDFYKEHTKKMILKENPHAHVEDLLHAAAFGEFSALGAPLVIPDAVLDKFSMETLISLWQRTANLNNMAVVGASTWMHDTLVDRIGKNHDVELNENDNAVPEAQTADFVSGTKIDLHPRAKYGSTHGSTAAYGAIGFPGPAAQDPIGTAAAQALMHAPAFEALAAGSQWASPLVAKSYAYPTGGLLGFYSQGLPQTLADVHGRVQEGLKAISAGKLSKDAVELMKLKASLVARSSREGLVDGMALRWSHGSLDDALSQVTATHVQAVARQAISTPPALAYHGDGPWSH